MKHSPALEHFCVVLYSDKNENTPTNHMTNFANNIAYQLWEPGGLLYIRLETENHAAFFD